MRPLTFAGGAWLIILPPIVRVSRASFGRARHVAGRGSDLAGTLVGMNESPTVLFRA
ncbi:presenilin-like A22 family membrane protease [Bradyrhizobium sp. F1.2.2]